MGKSTRNMVPGFPERLAALREEKGLSRQQLADLSGTSFSAISSLERGERAPSLELACRLADALGVGVQDFRPETGPKNNPRKITD